MAGTPSAGAYSRIQDHKADFYNTRGISSVLVIGTGCLTYSCGGGRKRDKIETHNIFNVRYHVQVNVFAVRHSGSAVRH